MSYIHGITINEIDELPTQPRPVPSAVIGLIGTAPAGTTEELVRVQNRTQAAQFGKQVRGFTIPQALDAIYSQSPDAVVLVTNLATDARFAQNAATAVTDETLTATTVSNTTALAYYPAVLGSVVIKDSPGGTALTISTDYTITATGAITVVNTGTYPAGTVLYATYSHYEVVTLVAGKGKLTNPPKAGAVTSVKDVTGATTYVSGTDYTVDEYGNIAYLPAGALLATSTIIVDYETLDLTAITAAAFEGSAVAPHKGMGLWLTSYAAFGYNPTILIAPEYSATTGIWQKLEEYATTLTAVAFVDGTTAWTVAQAIAARGVSSTDQFSISNRRVNLIYPRMQAYDPDTLSNVYRAGSQFIAGVMAATDKSFGYSRSLTNQPIRGITGLETSISFNPTKPSGTEANDLNAVGIITVGVAGGAGYKVWGDRSSIYPSDTTIKSFYAVRRVEDQIQINFSNLAATYIGRRINQALIDQIKEDGNAMLNRMIQAGDLIGGVITFDSLKNTATEISNGELEFDVQFQPAAPLEKLIINSVLNINLVTLE